MRSINVSTEVFAKLWSLRQEGEETEDDVLRRVLGCKPRSASIEAAREGDGGYHDPRHNTHFPEGFEIFRSYKGTDYRARATRGGWLLLNDGKIYPSLNALSNAVVDGIAENAWVNWWYTAENDERRRISDLRDTSKVTRRGGAVKMLSLENF